MNTSSPDTFSMLQSLKKAVSKALDRKRRLGQYAVIWKDGKVIFTEGDRDPDGTTPHNQPGAVGEDKADYPNPS